MCAHEKPRLAGASGAAKKTSYKPNCTDLFPDLLPARRITLPKPGTVKSVALRALLAGPVRQPDFPHSWRLAAYVQMLRNDGFSILSHDVPFRERTISQYRLDLSDDETARVANLLRGVRQ